MKIFRFFLIFAIVIFSAYSLTAGLDKKNYYRHALKNSNLYGDDRLAYLDSLLVLSPEDTVKLLESKAQINMELGRYGEAVKIVNKLLKQDLGKLPVDQQCNIYVLAIKSYKWDGNYADMINICNKLRSIPKADSLIYKDVDALGAMFDLNRVNINSGNQFLTQAENILKDAQRRNIDHESLKQIEWRVLFMKMTQAISLDSLNLAIRLSAALDSFNIPAYTRTVIELNTGYVYQKAGETGIAADYFRHILEESRPNFASALAVVNLTNALNSERKYQESINVFNTYRNNLRYLGNDISYTYALSNYAIALAGTGDYKNAYENILESKLRADSIYNDMTTIKNLYNYKMSDLDKKLTDSEQKSEVRKRANILLAIACGFLAIASAVLFFFLQRRITRLRAENEEADAKCRQLTENLQASNEEVTEMARTASGLNLKMEQFQRTLADIKETAESRSLTTIKKVNNVQQLIKTLDLSEDTWRAFNIHFEKINPSFFTTLRERYPDITPNDLRLAAYIRMNMSTKEIAELTSRTSRSVDTARYRLAKKLNLKQGVTLQNYLLSI